VIATPLNHGVDQYNNPDNADAYVATLAPEIWQQTSGRVTHFVSGGSTGGTVTGTGQGLTLIHIRAQLEQLQDTFMN